MLARALFAHFLPHAIMAHHANGAFGLIPVALRPATQRVGLSAGRRRLRSAGATLVPSEILGGLTVVSALVANGTFPLPTVTGATGLVALGGLRNGDHVDYVLQNNSVVAAGTATLAIDAGATFTLYGPLVVPMGCSLHTRIIMNSATTALCYTKLVGVSGQITPGPNLFSYVDIYQSAATGSTSTQGTYNAAGGAAVVTAAQLIGGYSYVGAAGGGVAITLPGAANTAAALLAKGIVAAAGLRLPPILIEVTDANNLTVTANAAADETLHGTVAINNITAAVHYVFTGAATAVAVIVQGA